MNQDRSGKGAIQAIIYLAFFLVFVTILVWWTRLQFVPDHDDLPNYLFNLLYALPPLGVSIAVIVAKRRIIVRGGAIGKIVRNVTLALIAFGVAQCVWTYYNLVVEVDVPTPSVADALYMVYYAFLIAALLGLIALNRSARTQIYLAYALPLSMIATGAVMAFILPVSLQGDLGLLVTNLVYVILDLAIVSLAVAALATGGGAIGESVTFLLVGAVVVAIGDVIFTYRSGIGAYWNGDLSDGLYALGSLLSSLALAQLAVTVGVASPSVPKPGQVNAESYGSAIK